MNQTPDTAYDNPYAPPQAAVHGAPGAVEADEFYVVATRKMLVLYFGTVGAYSLYWMWRHWKLHKLRHKLDIWPVPRAIFMVFFTHSLFREFDHRVQRQQLRFAWSPGGWATLFVVMTILGRILDRFAMYGVGWPVVDVISLSVLLPCGMALAKAQRVANLACGDPEGERNSGLGAANIVWLLIGALLWVLILIGLLTPPELLEGA